MRRIVDLAGSWDFVADLDPKYHNDRRIYRTPEWSRPEANRRHWLKVPVPGVWQKYGERYDIFEGVCWYSRSIDVGALGKGGSALLRFGGVNYLCRVFLNGAEVGGHEGGFTEFTIDVTAQLVSGGNHLAVMVDNRATTIKWPPCLGYFNYGGIHRAVSLEIHEGPSLCDPTVSARWLGGGGELVVKGKVLPTPVGPGIAVAAECDGVQARVSPDADGAYELRLSVRGAHAWSPSTPHLSKLRLRVLDGQQEQDNRLIRCGFRDLRFQEGRLLLGGVPIRLQGVCYVYDSPVTGLVMTEEQIARDVSLMKEMGCNAVRCHYPMDRRFYDRCDREGLLVWIEPPVYCYHPGREECDTGFRLAPWRELAQTMVAEMIRTARQHPSVAIYGIGNECNTANPEAEAFFRALADRVRAEDPDRLVSYAALYGNVGPLARIVDVLGVNSYYGWYDKVFGGKGVTPGAEPGDAEATVRKEPIDLTPLRSMLAEILRSSPDNLALLLTEFGADSVPGFRARGRDLWSEDYHADLLTAIFALAAEHPRIVGTFPFCFSDYRDPSKVHNGYWNELNLKGVVDYGRQKKLAFDAVKAAYGGSAEQARRL